MEIQFKTKKLEKCYLESKKAARAFGDQVARKYIQRINIIKAVKDINELKTMPGLRCHELKGNRKGSFAVNLTGYMRLIFTLQGEQLEIASIEEVSKHYGD